MSNDLLTMTPEAVALLTNRDVIAVDQDALGKQGDRVSAEGPIEIWTCTLADGPKAVGIFNRHHLAMTTQVDFLSLEFSRAVKAKDLWQGKDLGSIGSTYAVKISAHGVLFLKFSQ